MLNVIFVVSIGMTVLFLVAVYDALKSLNKAHKENAKAKPVLSRKTNEWASIILEGNITSYLDKTSDTYIKKRSAKESLQTLENSVIEEHKNTKLRTSPKLPYNIPMPMPISR